MTVDIMLPFYGNPDLLRHAVRSVQDQDDPDWRLVVVDDGYPDPSVRRWFSGLHDARIIYLRNAENLGANGNYRKCLEMIQHDTAVIMGADDVMLPNYVRTVKELRQAHPHAAVIQVGVELIDEKGRPYRSLADRAKQRLYAPRIRSTRLLRGEHVAVTLLRGNWLYFPALAWRSDALRETGFRGGFSVVHDLALVIDLLLAGQSIVVSPTSCFRYRRHRASDSSAQAATGSRFAEQRRYFLAIAKELDAHGWRRAARAARHHFSSRLHALTMLPQAIRLRSGRGIGNLMWHAVALGGLRSAGTRRNAKQEQASSHSAH